MLKSLTDWVLKPAALVAAMAMTAALSTGCDIDAEEGEMPEVEVEGGEMPEVDVDGPEVETGTKTIEMEVPTVDVDAPESDGGDVDE
jgi:hypothetical protein